jgi:hypothetical protein
LRKLAISGYGFTFAPCQTGASTLENVNLFLRQPLDAKKLVFIGLKIESVQFDLVVIEGIIAKTKIVFILLDTPTIHSMPGKVF